MGENVISDYMMVHIYGIKYICEYKLKHKPA